MSIKQIVEKVTHNWPIKIICFALAIVLYILHQASMIEKKTFIIPLTVINDGNYTYIGELDKKVSVVVKTSPEYMNTIQSEEITASIDLTSKKANNIYPVNITVDDSLLKIDPLEIQVKPEHITVNIEEKVMKYVKVKASIVDDVAPGYKIESVTCDPPFVEVIGAKSVVDKVDEVYTRRIPTSNASASFTAETSYYELNKLIEVPNKSPYKVTVEVLPEIKSYTFKDVPVSVLNLNPELEIETSLPKIVLDVEGTVPFLERYVLPLNAVSIDMSEITEVGDYELPLNIHVAGVLKILGISQDKVKVHVIQLTGDEEENPVNEEEIEESSVE
ncbi:MAG: hypothetical protein K5866_04655 [Treponema sp.]|nr:hypothetical protein [Treponema sp.]